MDILLNKILPNPDQPRTIFDDDEQTALTASFETHGQLLPIAVEGPYTNAGDDYYIILDGERRYRAAQELGWPTIKTDVRVPDPNLNGEHRLILALVGNLQRADLGPIDEAHAIAKLRKSMSAHDIATSLGRSNAHIHNRLRILNLSLTPEVLDLLNRRKIPFSYETLRYLAELSPNKQNIIAGRAAALRCTGTVIRGMCSRALRAAPFQRNPACRRQTKSGATIAPALAVHNVTLGEQHADLVEAIIKICEHCGLDDTRGVICRDCPLASLVKMLAEEEQNV